MRIPITELIRRPISLGIVLASVFLIGAIVGSLGIPVIWRDVSIYVVDGNATEDGCHGNFGITPIRFGRVGGALDGAYDIPCEKLAMFTDTVGLWCKCMR